MNNLSKRQLDILDIIKKQGEISTKEIKEHLASSLNRVTIIRDLDVLINNNLIKKTGKGRNVSYSVKNKNSLLAFFDPNSYFEQFIEQRNAKSQFNFNIFDDFNDSIFLEEELNKLDKKNESYRKRIKKLSPAILRKEFERLTIELSWKSSQIEGNTYSLIETETLIKEKIESPGHTKSEAQMILNHKNALDYIIENSKIFEKLTIAKIENLHKLLIFDLGVEKNIRKTLVGITGTVYRPLDNQFQIKEALEKTIAIINNKDLHPLVKALASIALISYIQPFEDGNKRTARILGNAVLIAHNYCPLSYRSINENDYKKATLLFYEQNSILFLKELFIQQFKASLDIYFLA